MAKLISNYEIYTEAKRGGRNYMEDVICLMKAENNEDETRTVESPTVRHVKVRCVPNNNEQCEDLSNSANDLLYLAVFDGHGGPEAAEFAKEHLLNEITKQKGFWTSDDAQVTRAIKDGFLSTHKLMWKALGSWPKTANGLPSTAGTTASVVLIKNKKLYVAHVGDSSVVFGTRVEGKKEWSALTVTKEHKPDAPEEQSRIERSGGQVMRKAGIARVVWRRPRVLKGPVRRSTQVDNVPFLAIARSLGDLWSYDSERDVFVVSPEPDVAVFDMDGSKQRCIILASDGIWNMIGSEEAVQIVHSWVQNQKGTEHESQAASILVDLALERWQNRNIRADNTSAIVMLLNPSVDYNNQVLNSCENQTAEKFTYSRISPSKSCLLPIHHNLQSSVAEKRQRSVTPLCGKGVLRKIMSKEDRVSVRRSKQKRRAIPGFRIHWANAGSGDGRRKMKVVSRRYSVPTTNVRNTSCSPLVVLSSGVLTTPEKFSMRTVSNARIKLLSKSAGQIDLCKFRRLDISLLRCNSPKRPTSVLSPERFDNYSIKKSTAVEGIDSFSPPTSEPRVAADQTPTLLDYSIVGDFLTPSPYVCLNDSPDQNNSDLSAALRLKRKNVDVADCPAKQSCRVAAYSDVSQTYRSRYHTRLRISQDCVTHAN